MRLARHSIYNLLGMGLPLLLGLLAMPALLGLLGVERFGWLTLLWALVSYLGLFDLGLPRVLTQLLAPAVQRDDWSDVGRILGSAAVMVLGLGLVVGGGLWAGAGAAARALIQGAEAERLAHALRWMALALPLTLLTAAMRGALEACDAFRSINLIRLPLGLWTFAGPWMAAVWIEPDLGVIAAALAAGRAAAFVGHAVLLHRALAPAAGHWRTSLSQMLPMLKAGGWLTVGNVVSPLMGYADRFILAALLSGSAAAYYAAPQEIVTKLWIIPGAITAVLLPAFARRQQVSAGASGLFGGAVSAVFLALLPFTLGLAWWAPELLSVWLGAEFGQHSAPVLMVFALGIQVNGAAHVALTWLHAGGRYRAPAVLQVVELPVFLALVWAAAATWGLMGAAVAWLLRMVIDTACLFWLCGLDRQLRPFPRVWRAGFAALGLFVLAPLALPWPVRAALWLAVTMLGVAWAWRMRSAWLGAAKLAKESS